MNKVECLIKEEINGLELGDIYRNPDTSGFYIIGSSPSGGFVAINLKDGCRFNSNTNNPTKSCNNVFSNLVFVGRGLKIKIERE